MLRPFLTLPRPNSLDKNSEHLPFFRKKKGTHFLMENVQISSGEKRTHFRGEARARVMASFRTFDAMAEGAYSHGPRSASHDNRVVRIQGYPLGEHPPGAYLPGGYPTGDRADEAELHSLGVPSTGHPYQ